MNKGYNRLESGRVASLLFLGAHLLLGTQRFDSSQGHFRMAPDPALP
jgi:hypothetical protein